MPPAKARKYHDLAEIVIARYMDNVEHIKWLGERDNATYKVTAAGERWDDSRPLTKLNN